MAVVARCETGGKRPIESLPRGFPFRSSILQRRDRLFLSLTLICRFSHNHHSVLYPLIASDRFWKISIDPDEHINLGG